MFQGGKPRQTSETIRYLAPKTIGQVFDVFESSVGLADEACRGQTDLSGLNVISRIGRNVVSGTVYWPTDTGTEIYYVGKAL
jgi:hypothetical protein